MNRTVGVFGTCSTEAERFHLQKAKEPSLKELKSSIKGRVDTAMDKLLAIKSQMEIIDCPEYLIKTHKPDVPTHRVLYDNLEVIIDRLCWVWEKSFPGE